MQVLTIASVQVGKPRRHVTRYVGSETSEQWRSGIFKTPVLGPVWVSTRNLDGDGQEHLQFHGGPDRAVLAFPSSAYAKWEDRLGHRLEFGSFGENLTLEGPAEDSICLGDVWKSPQVTLEISQPRVPCVNLSRRLGCEKIHLEVTSARRAGWYLRVLQEGEIASGETLELMSRPHPEWTVQRAFETYIDKASPERSELAEIEALSELWKRILGGGA